MPKSGHSLVKIFNTSRIFFSGCKQFFQKWLVIIWDRHSFILPISELLISSRLHKVWQICSPPPHHHNLIFLNHHLSNLNDKIQNKEKHFLLKNIWCYNFWCFSHQLLAIFALKSLVLLNTNSKHNKKKTPSRTKMCTNKQLHIKKKRNDNLKKTNKN